MRPKTYYLPYSVETASWKPVAAHFRLNGALGSAVPLQPEFEVEQLEGLYAVLRVTDRQLTDQDHSGAFSVAVRDEKREEVRRVIEENGTQEFVFEVKAQPRVAPVLPGMPAGVTGAAFGYSGVCSVKLAVPDIQIKQRSNEGDAPRWVEAGEPLVVDSRLDRPAQVRAVLRTVDDAAGTVTGVPGAFRVRTAEQALPDAVGIRKTELDNEILHLDLSATRFLVGTGQEPLDAVELRFHATPTLPPEHRWEDPPRVPVQLRAAPVHARIEVREHRAHGNDVLLASATRELTGEVVELHVEAGETPPDWARVSVDLFVEEPSPWFAASHHTRRDDVRLRPSGRGADATVDLRLEPDAYGPTCAIHLPLSDVDQDGIWLFVADKWGWDSVEAVSVRDLDVDDAALASLLKEGGHLLVSVHGTYEAPGGAMPPIDRPIVDLHGSLQVDDERSVVARSVLDADGHSSLDFAVPGADGTVGPAVVRTRATQPIDVDDEIADVLGETLREAQAIAPRLAERAEIYVEAAVSKLAEWPDAALVERGEGLLNRLAATRDFFGFAGVVGQGIGLSLAVREQLVMRQITNLIDGLVELASFGASEGYTWWKQGKNAKKSIAELSERSIRNTVAHESRQLSELLGSAEDALQEAVEREAKVMRDLDLGLAKLDRLAHTDPLRAAAFSEEVVALSGRLSDVSLEVQSLLDSRNFARSQVRLCTEVTESTGEAFQEKLAALMDAFKAREQKMPALMADLHRRVQSSTGPRVSSTIANLRGLRDRVAVGVSRVPGVRPTGAETQALLAAIDEHIRGLEAIAQTRKPPAAAVLTEVAESRLSKLASDAATEARRTKGLIDQQRHQAQSFENYSDMWFGPLWTLMDEASATVSGWYYGSASIRQLGSWVAEGASELVQRVAHYLRMLTEWIDGEDMASLQSSQLPTSAVEQWQTLDALHMDLDRFLGALEAYQTALKARAGLLDPKRVSGTFDRSEVGQKKADEEAAARREVEQATRRLTREAHEAVVDVCMHVLSASHLDHGLTAERTDDFHSHDRQARALLHQLERYRQGVRLSNEDVLAWWPSVAAEALGGRADDTWQDVENTIELITFSSSVALRGGALLGTFSTLGAGAAAGGGLLLAAEIVDGVGIALRVAIASAGSLRVVNAIPMDLLVTLALCYDDVFRHTKPAES